MTLHLTKCFEDKNINFRIHSVKNIKNYTELLNNVEWNSVVNISNSLDENVQCFLHHLLRLYNQAFPIVTSKRNSLNKDWVNFNVKNMIRHKNYLLRRMRKTNIHEDITRFELFNTNLKKNHTGAKTKLFF